MNQTTFLQEKDNTQKNDYKGDIYKGVGWIKGNQKEIVKLSE